MQIARGMWLIRVTIQWGSGFLSSPLSIVDTEMAGIAKC